MAEEEDDAAAGKACCAEEGFAAAMTGAGAAICMAGVTSVPGPRVDLIQFASAVAGSGRRLKALIASIATY